VRRTFHSSENTERFNRDPVSFVLPVSDRHRDMDETTMIPSGIRSPVMKTMEKRFHANRSWPSWRSHINLENAGGIFQWKSLRDFHTVCTNPEIGVHERLAWISDPRFSSGGLV